MQKRKAMGLQSMTDLFDILEPDFIDLVFDDSIAAEEAVRRSYVNEPERPSSTITPRPYQIAAIDAFFDSWKESNSALAVMATGSGKTVIAGGVANRALRETGRDFLFLSHREDLVRQAAKTFRKMCQPFHVGIEMADERTVKGDRAPRIISASKDTLYQPSRLKEFDPERFSHIFVDECHHFSPQNKSYSDITNYFKNFKLGGLTATPDRADEIPMGLVFGSVAYVYDILDAILDGWLVPIDQKVYYAESIDISELCTVSGDLKEADVAAVMRKEKPKHLVAKAAIEASNVGPGLPRRKTVIFTASVGHAHDIAEILNREHALNGTGAAAAIDSVSMNPSLRNSLKERHQRGDFPYLVNYGMTVEGYDDPGIEVVLIARMTKSRATYSQMIGRGGRPLEELMAALLAALDADARRGLIHGSKKPKCVVVDIIGISGKHKLITAADILGGKYSDDIVEAAKKALKESEGGDVLAALMAAKAEAESADAERRKKISMNVKIGKRTVDPFDLFDISSEREPGWMKGKPATDKQKMALERIGIQKPKIKAMSQHQAAKIIVASEERRKGSLCTYAQAKTLVRFGYSPNADKKTAGEILTRLRNNGWRR